MEPSCSLTEALREQTNCLSAGSSSDQTPCWKIERSNDTGILPADDVDTPAAPGLHLVDRVESVTFSFVEGGQLVRLADSTPSEVYLQQAEPAQFQIAGNDQEVFFNPKPEVIKYELKNCDHAKRIKQGPCLDVNKLAGQATYVVDADVYSENCVAVAMETTARVLLSFQNPEERETDHMSSSEVVTDLVEQFVPSSEAAHLAEILMATNENKLSCIKATTESVDVATSGTQENCESDMEPVAATVAEHPEAPIVCTLFTDDRSPDMEHRSDKKIPLDSLGEKVMKSILQINIIRKLI